jgi:hypothetical protein
MARVGTGAGWVGPWVGVRPGVGWWEGVFKKLPVGTIGFLLLMKIILV